MNEIVEKIRKDITDILSGNDEKLVEDARIMGEYLVRGEVSTSQIRNIFSKVKRMKSYEKNKTDLLLLRPKLAYVAGRHGKRKGKELTGAIVDLQVILDECIRKIKDEKSFKKFQDFFEAILAYHRYYGGKE